MTAASLQSKTVPVVALIGSDGRILSALNCLDGTIFWKAVHHAVLAARVKHWTDLCSAPPLAAASAIAPFVKALKSKGALLSPATEEAAVRQLLILIVVALIGAVVGGVVWGWWGGFLLFLLAGFVAFIAVALASEPVTPKELQD